MTTKKRPSKRTATCPGCGKVTEVPDNWMKYDIGCKKCGREVPVQDIPLIELFDVDFWSERDRLGIWVTDKQKDKIVFEVWDDDARQLFEDGFVKPGEGLKESLLEYLKETKVI